MDYLWGFTDYLWGFMRIYEDLCDDGYDEDYFWGIMGDEWWLTDDIPGLVMGNSGFVIVNDDQWWWIVVNCFHYHYHLGMFTMVRWNTWCIRNWKWYLRLWAHERCEIKALASMNFSCKMSRRSRKKHRRLNMDELLTCFTLTWNPRSSQKAQLIKNDQDIKLVW